MGFWAWQRSCWKLTFLRISVTILKCCAVLESPKQLSKLRQAVEANDFETIERTAHGLKGELKYLGLAEAAQKASGFERFGREKCLQLPADSLSNLEADIINVTGCMKQMLEDKRTLN